MIVGHKGQEVDKVIGGDENVEDFLGFLEPSRGEAVWREQGADFFELLRN